MKIRDIEVPPVVNDAVAIGADYAIGRFIIFPILMVVAVLAGLIFGASGTAVVLVVIVVGCILWILSASVSSFAHAFPGIETWEASDGTVHISKEGTVTVYDWNKWYAGLNSSQKSRILWRPASSRRSAEEAWSEDRMQTPRVELVVALKAQGFSARAWS